MDVYSRNNGDKIGNISELIFDSSGKVQAVVIGVGGNLGIGTRVIAVPFDPIRFVNEPRDITTGMATGEACLARASPGGGSVALVSAGTAALPAGSNNPFPSHTAANNAPTLSHLKRREWDKPLLAGAAPPVITPFF